MKFKVQDLEYTKIMYGNVMSMRSLIVDEDGNCVATSPFGSMNVDFKDQLDKCETKQDVLALTDQYFYGRLFDGVCKSMGVK
jgi:hypothetical protein